MSNEELKIYIESMISNLEKYEDDDKFMKGYIEALEHILEKIKGQ